MAMKSRVLKGAPGRLGRLILRRLFDKAHLRRRPHVSWSERPAAPAQPTHS